MKEDIMKKIVTEALRMKKVLSVLTLTIIAVSFLLVTGCHKRAVTRPEETPPPVAKEQPEAMQKQKGPEKITEQKVESVASKDAAATYAEGKEGMFEDILFDYDKYDVKGSYKAVMQSVAAWMMKNSSATLSIEGHCDERGTNEYNLALGDRRAKSVKDYLVSLGVPSSRIETISYGEEKPLCTEQSEECWAKNRRAHFVILMKAGK
jgi:peptidoglycan-associated lipoprotein